MIRQSSVRAILSLLCPVREVSPQLAEMRRAAAMIERAAIVGYLYAQATEFDAAHYFAAEIAAGRFNQPKGESPQC